MTTALTPVGAGGASWPSGFWGSVGERTRTVTVPDMWQALRDPDASPALRNFRIAAGLEDGDHAGPPFMDGDFYKWLEAAIAQLETHPEPWLAETVDELARLIASVQREDGYLHTATLIAQRHHEGAAPLADRFHFETYNLGHLITMGVRHHEVTGSSVLLDVARRAAGFLESLATEKPVELARSAICPSHYMAVLELYRATGEARYLDLARGFLRVRDEFDEGGDDNQDRLAVFDQTVVAGHAVRANYLYAGLADLVAETGDTALRGVLEHLWDDVVHTKLYLTGGCGALYDGASPDGHPWQEEISRIHQAYGRAYQLPHTTAHAESCANIGMILWSERMLAVTGDAKYADVIEQVAFNALLAGISLDGREYFYTNALRQVRDLPFELRRPGDTGLHPVPAPPPSDERLRERYLSCFCCPPNTARTLSRFHERAASVGAEGVFVHQYGGSEVRVAGEDGHTLALRESSDYPWDGRIVFAVTEAQGGGLPLHLRIPGWSRGATVRVNGEAVPVTGAGTYTRLDRAWSAGDEVVLELPMPVRMLRGHRLVEEATGQVAIQRGPVVYCVESADLPPGVRLEQAALRRGSEFRAEEAEIAGTRMTVLETELAVLPESGDALWDDLSTAPVGAASVRLVPYFAWANRGPGEMSVWLPVVW
ncbi:glycoside hydrolase family 127 protein [Microbacterium sp. EYE_5]|uniref:glycoside hydrolase family 127 protein n=1 Tax=unclassified Microbacterium TaxID=2609290 RepID=UPI0020047F64|nr:MULTISPECIES: beta-L-arabinofuranosidase domain-containing protein [unclassified Microbacterium]MCK6079168.1 glycoside hydrolase family 127 protein [Microbacterium sp. EYE_382]MCK6084438.1 glycoside hydrolase family 127 protein [Microbacterium sp. EYE_384]MCK6123333.1 glycoside hydrolase family 127 protein [Microbacterium sp. EYE_80]MCK6125202.1 glycoside hydrolase family 127 protein [Microbacterium sp. EYE_79]MCK6140122.1 glycoside hydrolase family 127 protein [Microbacterium sp. EYE_39]